jgi:hypothetical protein
MDIPKLIEDLRVQAELTDTYTYEEAADALESLLSHAKANADEITNLRQQLASQPSPKVNVGTPGHADWGNKSVDVLVEALRKITTRSNIIDDMQIAVLANDALATYSNPITVKED